MAAAMAKCRKFLFHLAHEHLEFRIPEVLSIANLLGIDFKVPDNYDHSGPFLVVELPSEEQARQIMTRTVMVKSLIELWVQGRTYDDLKSKLKQLPDEFKNPYFDETKSFCFRVDSFNKIIPFQEKLKKMEYVLDETVLPFKGKVELKNPTNMFQILEDYGTQDPQSPDNPSRIFMGRWLSDGQRDHVQKYHLQNRKYIGNTSMDAKLSLIMANMGKVKSGSFVFDPFVGTGSLLISSAHFGGYVMGTDLDYKTIHGIGRASRHNQKWRAKDENVRANFEQYNLGDHYLGVLVADASKHTMWRQRNIFDAIITDPPYGIREKTKKVGTEKDSVEIEDQHKDGHIPSRVSYELSDIMKDLLNFSAKYLTMGGRLVYWLPVCRPEYVEENVPCHPCLKLVANSEQALNSRIGRRLITMEKIKDVLEEDVHNSATLVEDHYGDKSFRDRYFKIPLERRANSPKHNQDNERVTNMLHSAGHPLDGGDVLPAEIDTNDSIRGFTQDNACEVTEDNTRKAFNKDMGEVTETNMSELRIACPSQQCFDTNL